MRLDLESINRLAKIHNLPKATKYSPEHYESNIPIIAKAFAVNINEPLQVVNMQFTRFVFEKIKYRLNNEYGYCYVLASNVKEDRSPPRPDINMINNEIRKREKAKKRLRELALKELSDMPFELKRLAKQTYYENVSLGGSLRKYDSFIDYFETEILTIKN